MLRSVAVAVALLAAAPSLAAGAMSVSTDFPSPLFTGDPFYANLQSIGVGVELDAPTDVFVGTTTPLTFRLLESRRQRNGFETTSLVVGGTTFAISQQAFSSPGTVLGTVNFTGPFQDQIGYTDSLFPDAPPTYWPLFFQVYINSADAGNLTGIGPYTGTFNTLYFSAGAALFQVTAVPEPSTWALLITGFGLTGAAMRRRAVAA